TKVHIIVYTLMLVVVSVFPFFSGMSGLLYLVSALALGAGFIGWSGLLMFKPKPSTPMDTFRYSILYLALLFIALVVDHYLI
ncbi:MAG: protoheme IX farnesyltransferase, partial [Pseudohongiellaceae bacterium]